MIGRTETVGMANIVELPTGMTKFNSHLDNSSNRWVECMERCLVGIPFITYHAALNSHHHQLTMVFPDQGAHSAPSLGHFFHAVANDHHQWVALSVRGRPRVQREMAMLECVNVIAEGSPRTSSLS
ncbi:hypothetical protein PMIN05_002795 [Paraphaeosphaeria minitans]